MDFLASIPEAPPRMAPLGTAPDGTLPLPLTQDTDIPEEPMMEHEVEPEAQHALDNTDMTDTPDPADEDVFDADPFFNPEAAPNAPLEETPFPESDDIPVIIHASVAPPSVPVVSAEERLLDTIVATTPEPTPKRTTADEITMAALETDLEVARASLSKAESARERARQDLQILKTRFSTLESDLSDAREAAGKAEALRAQAETQHVQAEARHVEAERQWTDKLAHLRRMLEEVEEFRDELSQKRVPRLMFVSAIVAGIITTSMAFLIGSHQAPSKDDTGTPSPSAEVAAKPILPPAAPVALPPTEEPAPAVAVKPPEVVKPIEPPHPAPIVDVPVEEPSKPTKPHVVTPVKPVKPTVVGLWPALEGGSWKATQTGSAMKVVFNYGTFSKGVELSDTAKHDLKAIAAALKAKGSHFHVDVEGHTDAEKVKKARSYGSNNQALGLARAKSAAAYLIHSGGLSPSNVTTSSAGESNPPYPNTSMENRAKNRTVVLKITRTTASSARSP